MYRMYSYRLERQNFQRVLSTQGANTKSDPLRVVRDREWQQPYGMPGRRARVQEVPHEPRPLREHAISLAYVRKWRIATVFLQVRGKYDSLAYGFDHVYLYLDRGMTKIKFLLKF